MDDWTNQRHIINTVRFVERYPELPVIVDHMAKPMINQGELASWARDMEQFRQLDHVHCKLSGILTEDGSEWTAERVQPYLEMVIDIFGAAGESTSSMGLSST